MTFDKIILGAGLYGLFAALLCGKRGEEVAVIEKESAPFMRATYINQARVHMGYHYPRSLATALKSKGYFERFNEEFGFAIHAGFEKIYATSANFSWTSAGQFEKFCRAADIYCEAICADKYFNPYMCDGAFLTREYTYDAHIIRDFLLAEIEKLPTVKIYYETNPQRIENDGVDYVMTLQSKEGDLGKEKVKSSFVLNATYAGINQVGTMRGFPLLQIKYELCEMIIVRPGEMLKNIGFTVMDGTFFSIMPFGKTGFHSLTSVAFTPHLTSYSQLPTFFCQEKAAGFCDKNQLGNCNLCPQKPETAWPYMANLARKYLKSEYEFSYEKSLFSIKPILMASEVDDSRPTLIRKMSENPTFVSVLSGKINTVYELEEFL